MLRYLDDWLILASSKVACLQARDRLLQVCDELGIRINHRKSSDTVTDSNIPRNGHSVGSVHGQTYPSPGNQSLPRDRGVPLISESPSVHLASTSGSPVISHSSGERRHAEDAPSAIVPPVPMGLPERPCSYFMESSLQTGPSLVVQNDPRRRRCRSLPSSPRSQLLLGRF